VAKEIDLLAERDIARYLVHRYRYEIHPQLHALDEFPPYLQIEPTSICNYRCVFCYQTDNSFTRRSKDFMGHMTLETFMNLIDQAESNIEFISLASRGEPMLCKDINSMLAYTRGKFLNLKLNTNASVLDEEKAHAILQSGVNTLVFSADAAEEPLYSQLRVNGSLEKVLGNLGRFQKIRETQYSQVKIITRVSGVRVRAEQDLEGMVSYWGGLVDQVAFVDYVPWENVYDATYTNIATPCSDLWRRMFVWWDGRVNPCDVDYRSTLTAGLLAGSKLKDLWRSEAYEALRSRHAGNQRSAVSPCNRCVVV
jgi:MoaA/NifB/PqqE/SkfB family radical SAM enzyme